MQSVNKINYREGLQGGVPIALGYLAVSFTPGIAGSQPFRLSVRLPCGDCSCMVQTEPVSGFHPCVSGCVRAGMALKI